MDKEIRSAKPEEKRAVAKAYRGMKNPVVELTDEDALYIRVQPEGQAAAGPAGEETIRVSLESVQVEMHNQSYGMISASTGCISNPGGPSC